ncbi:MAG TPA: YtxH domain-containing protein [Acidobacteriota bacterium]|jgi:gas vesicle protein|nr:YtxH domain-containing protein [Acidobacteriota bacterium]
MGRDDNKLNAVILLLAGAAAGAALALLFAPQAGKKTRRDLQRLGQRARDRATEFQTELRGLVEDVIDTTSQGLDKGREFTEKVRGDVVDILESGRKILENEKARVQSMFR